MNFYIRIKNYVFFFGSGFTPQKKSITVYDKFSYILVFKNKPHIKFDHMRPLFSKYLN